MKEIARNIQRKNTKITVKQAGGLFKYDTNCDVILNFVKAISFSQKMVRSKKRNELLYGGFAHTINLTLPYESE
jgi:hypothetical protein